MSFFKKEIPKDEWEKKYRKIAEDYDNSQKSYQASQADISLTGEQLRQIALAKKGLNKGTKEIDASADEEKAGKDPSSTPSQRS